MRPCLCAWVKPAGMLIFLLLFSVGLHFCCWAQDDFDIDLSELEELEKTLDVSETEEGFEWKGDTVYVRFSGDVKNISTDYSVDERSILNPDDLFLVTRAENITEIKPKLDANIADRFEFFAYGKITYEYFRTRDKTDVTSDSDFDQLYATLEFGKTVNTFISIGKQLTKWGTGHYWNPVDTFNREQDLQEKEEAEEGRTSYRVDVQLSAFSSSFIYVPNMESEGTSERDLTPEEDQTLFAGKIYTFLADTDITLYGSIRDRQEPRWGFSFSTVVSDIQFFGETVYWEGKSERSYVSLTSERTETYDPVGNSTFYLPASYEVKTRDGNFYKGLLGIQYTFSNDLTLIAEYYHNEQGYTKDEFETYIDYLEYVGKTYQSDLDSIDTAKESNPLLQTPDYPSRYSMLLYGSSLYEFAGLQKDFFHLSLKKPYWWENRFDLKMDWILCLNDFDYGKSGSFFMRSSIAYRAVTNWLFTLYGEVYGGTGDTEFGMVSYNNSLSLEIKYFF